MGGTHSKHRRDENNINIFWSVNHLKTYRKMKYCDMRPENGNNPLLDNGSVNTA
jgi:hypothetical protein